MIPRVKSGNPGMTARTPFVPRYFVIISKPQQGKKFGNGFVSLAGGVASFRRSNGPGFESRECVVSVDFSILLVLRLSRHFRSAPGGMRRHG